MISSSISCILLGQISLLLEKDMANDIIHSFPFLQCLHLYVEAAGSEGDGLVFM
jgi:hypothetical protein